MKTRMLMLVAIILFCMTFVLARGQIEVVHRNIFAPFVMLYALMLYFYIAILTLSMPFVGVIAINEMPEDKKVYTFYMTAHKLSFFCLWSNFVLPPIFVFLSLLPEILYGSQSSRLLVSFFLVCSVISFSIANISQMVINGLLFYKYRNSLQIFALATQILMCLTIYFASILFGQLNI
jgi:hypothetical protein